MEKWSKSSKPPTCHKSSSLLWHFHERSLRQCSQHLGLNEKCFNHWTHTKRCWFISTHLDSSSFISIHLNVELIHVNLSCMIFVYFGSHQIHLPPKMGIRIYRMISGASKLCQWIPRRKQVTTLWKIVPWSRAACNRVTDISKCFQLYTMQQSNKCRL